MESDGDYNDKGFIIYKKTQRNVYDSSTFIDHKKRYEELRKLRERIKEYIRDTQSFVESLNKLEIKNTLLDISCQKPVEVQNLIKQFSAISLSDELELKRVECVSELEGNDTCELLEELNSTEYAIEKNAEYWRYRL
jgi:predicted patatin/cPLA2 family phospholipase